MPTRAQLVAAINTFRGRNPTNPIDDDEFANFMQSWLDYYDQNGAWAPSNVTSLIAQNVALQNSFVSRSLTLNTICFLDATNGKDSNTGAGAGTAVKTLERVIQLYSGKAVNLVIYIIGTIEIKANLTISATNIWFLFLDTGKMYFRKLPTNNGNYYLLIDALNTQFLTPGAGLGIVETEAHGGNVASETQEIYGTKQGAIRLLKMPIDDWRSGYKIQVMSVCVVSLVAGANTTIFAGHEDGIFPLDYMKTSYIFYGQLYSPSLGTNASFDSGFNGNKVFPRAYTPTSSTDSKVVEGEMAADNNFLYRKNGGVIKKIAWINF